MSGIPDPAGVIAGPGQGERTTAPMTGWST